MSNHIDKIIPIKNIIGPSSKNKITPIKKTKIIIALLSFLINSPQYFFSNLYLLLHHSQK